MRAAPSLLREGPRRARSQFSPPPVRTGSGAAAVEPASVRRLFVHRPVASGTDVGRCFTCLRGAMPESLVRPSCGPGRRWPRCAIGALALLCDAGGQRVAMVEPTYHTRGLILIGGAVEEDEDPPAALSREVHEETRLRRTAVRLLVTEWVSADPDRDKPAGVNFVFDVEPLRTGEWDSIVLPPGELKSKHLIPLADAPNCTTDRLLSRRITTAIQARNSGTHEFLLPPE
ncbi:NUDIX domain-containing protein [Streptomyces sp. CMB-StM0423]|uniref:NUDIX domain-containing protein n=1 Tax=Streptomyces sp. CMB-StM0423 TaxID=2059884 RepID=UPI000C71594B|nr:NUDIX hydrolase [Streptomyces sp. CMB-StM0423]AUH40466.1 hypothetical protein CXR04_09545 [Streptomyces sp. CMB-StM0423]